MCIELGMHLHFLVAGGSLMCNGPPNYISVLLAHRRPSESPVLFSCGQPRKILVLLSLVIHPLIR